MKAMINVEGNQGGDTTQNVDALKEAIVWIMETAFNTHMSEEVVIRAINALGSATDLPNNITNITSSNFTSRDAVMGGDD